MNVWLTPLGQATLERLPDVKANVLGQNDVLAQIIAAQRGTGTAVTPENCEQSPTVKAIITAVSNRFAVTPVHIYQTGTKNGRESKEPLPNHPVAKLLDAPNKYQSRADFFSDAASTYLRYGNFVAYKGRGKTGPIRFIKPFLPSQLSYDVDSTANELTYRYGAEQTYGIEQLLHVRGPSRNFLYADSPIKDIAETIALEIAAEKFGLSFFNNGALPLMIFRYMQGTQPYKNKDDEKQFVSDFQSALGGNNRHRALLMPKGIETGDPIRVENDKAQMIETRRYQRTVIAGALGVPPQYVGDLERATFNNAEQQTIQFTSDVIYPIAQRFEAALERDLLTVDDRRSGVVIRFNLDSILRADFKSRQEGLQIQRLNGVISADEWREIEQKNPIDGKGGAEYWRPSNMGILGAPMPEPVAPAPAVEPKPNTEKNLTVNVTANVQTKVDGTTVDIAGDRTTIEQPAHHVTNNLPASDITVPVTVEGSKVNILPSDVTVNVPPAEVKVFSDVTAPDVHVASPVVNIQNDVASPVVNVAAPQVTVEPPEVHVKAPNVTVEAPNVTVEPTVVNVAAPDVKVNVEPQIDVQPVTVKAPDVHVHNELPEYEVIESQAVRDDKGRLSKTVTTKKRK
jgi:HK97 family phage portal protein